MIAKIHFWSSLKPKYVAGSFSTNNDCGSQKLLVEKNLFVVHVEDELLSDCWVETEVLEFQDIIRELWDDHKGPAAAAAWAKM